MRAGKDASGEFLWDRRFLVQGSYESQKSSCRRTVCTIEATIVYARGDLKKETLLGWLQQSGLLLSGFCVCIYKALQNWLAEYYQKKSLDCRHKTPMCEDRREEKNTKRNAND
jgi:hypothetical protein